MSVNTTNTPIVTNYKKPILNDKDFYWELIDDDMEYDGTLHIVCTIDGSMLKVPVKPLLDVIKANKLE